MYTYSKPDYAATTTRSSIEYRAKREVYHAMQHGSAVGFTGSGMTCGYGRLNYNELVRLLVRRVLDEVKIHMKSRRLSSPRKPLTAEQNRDVRRLGGSLAQQLGQPEAFTWYKDTANMTVDIRVDFMKAVETSTALLEVLTELARAVGNEDILAREVARLFQSRPLDQFDARLQLVGGWQDDRQYKINRKNRKIVTRSIHERWIHAVFLPDCVLTELTKAHHKSGAEGPPRFLVDPGDGGDHLWCEPEVLRLVEAFQWAFQKDRRDLSQSVLADDCREAIIAAYQAAMRTIDASISRELADAWYKCVRKSFDDTTSCLFDPCIGERPDMKQIVLSAWNVLAARPRNERDDAYRAVFFSLAHIRDLDDVALKDWPDPIDSTVRSLGLTRLLTVNYDHELERYFRRRFGFEFSNLNVDSGESRGLPTVDEPDEDRKIFYNGTGVRLIRAEMQKTSVSELLDFSIPHDEDIHLYYLHGRAGEPDTTKRDHVILAERDYQRHYLENTHVRRGFDESLRSLFAANTVIFLGIGMNEGDLLRPLRQFVSDDQKWRRTSGGPVVIMNGSSAAEDERKAAEFNVSFGAKTIFFDTSLTIQGTAGPEEIGRQDIWALQNFIKDKLLATENAGGRTVEDWDSMPGKIERLVEHELGLHKLCGLVANDPDGWLLQHAMLGRLETFILTASLDRYLKGLTQQHAAWLDELNRLPDQRMARFVDWRSEYKDGGKHLKTLWIRQRIRHGAEETTQPDDCPHFSPLLNCLATTHPSPVECSNGAPGRRVVRIFGRRGVGKGALIHALQDPAGFGRLFPTPPGVETAHYAGAFFADARYSTEFNSVITALARFIAGRVAEAKGKNAQEVSEVEVSVFEDGTQPRIDDLNCCFVEIEKGLHEFSKVANRKRLLICLSGIERLFRSSGLAYQAIHGAFFRILLHERLKGYPIDVVILLGAESLGQVLRIDDLQPKLGGAKAGAPDETKYLVPGIAEGAGRFEGAPLYPDTTARSVDAHAHWCELRIVPLLSDEPDNDGTLNDDPQRKWIIKNLGHDAPALNFFRMRIARAYREKDETLDFRRIQTLYRLLEANACLVMWLLHLIDEAKGLNGETTPSDDTWATAALGFAEDEFLARFEVAAHGGEAQVIEEIMNCYRSLDEPRRLGDAPLDEPADSTVRDEIMRHLAFFSVPIERAVLASCPQIADLAQAHFRRARADEPEQPTERDVAEWLNGHLEVLYRRRLIVRLHPARPRDVRPVDNQNQDAHIRYFLHSRIREFISRQMNFDLFEVGEHSFFNLSLYGAQPKDMPSPRTHDYRFVGEILHRLIRQSRMDLHPFFETREEPTNRCVQTQRDEWRIRKITAMDTPLSPTRRVRAAQGLLAGSFSIGVITRFDNLRGLPERLWEDETPFDNYSNWLRSLTNLANAIDKTKDKYAKAVQASFKAGSSSLDTAFDWSDCQGVTRPFYPNEIAWLYNERALGKLVQGKLGESLALFRQADTLLQTLRWERMDDGPTGSSRRILALNEAVALIEFGRAEEAAKLLRPIAEYNNAGARTGLMLTPHLAKGYLGLINHLQGRLGRAERQYRDAINALHEVNVPRGAAIFQKHLGDLYRGLKRFDEAEELINHSIAEAKSTRQMDIFHMARISLARVRFGREQDVAAGTRQMLEEAMTYGERLGIPKIVVEVDTLLAGVHIRNHELDAAGERLVRAIALSSRHHMSLRKIAAVQTYLLLAEERDDNKLVKRMRRKLSDLTEKFDYQLPSSRILGD